MRNYASFCISSGLRGLTLPRPDLIIATSPQLLVAVSGWWLGFARQVPFVLEVHDLWARIAHRCRHGQRKFVVAPRTGGRGAFLYERADRVVVTPACKQHLIQRWRVPDQTIFVIENGVEADLFAPQPQGPIVCSANS